jgi:hypothetical protein
MGKKRIKINGNLVGKRKKGREEEES